MNIQEARTAIEAILAAIPDSELPKFDRVEIDGTSTCVWYGGRGRYLGSAKKGTKRDPDTYRSNGSWEAIEYEMACRADRKFLANGDKPDGLKLAKREVRR